MQEDLSLGSAGTGSEVGRVASEQMRMQLSM
jgi:hypothetical protein